MLYYSSTSLGQIPGSRVTGSKVELEASAVSLGIGDRNRPQHLISYLLCLTI